MRTLSDYKLPATLVQSIVNYLTGQPYKDVAGLLATIMSHTQGQDAQAQARWEQRREEKKKED